MLQPDLLLFSIQKSTCNFRQKNPLARFSKPKN